MACTAKSDVAETGTNNKSSLIHESKVDINEDGIKSIHQLEKDENINSFDGEISLNSLRLKTESEDHVFESQSTQETGNSIENNYQPDVQENKNIEEEIANCDNNSCKDSNTVQVTSVNDMSHISNTHGTNDNAPEYFSDQSESGDEYESASEGEEIQTDSVTLKELEERLTDEEKQVSFQHGVLTFSKTTDFILSQIQNNKFSVFKIELQFSDRTENIVGKGENAGYQYCLLFLQCFQKFSFPWS